MRILQQRSSQALALGCLTLILAGCGTAEYERRLNANLTSLGANSGGAANGAPGAAGYQTIEDYPEYEIQIPDSYSAPTIVEETPNFRIQWQGPPRDDQTRPQLQMSINEIEGELGEDRGREEGREYAMRLRELYPDLQANAPEIIEVHGMPGILIAWSGTDANSVPFQGFSYFLGDENRLISIEWHDTYDDAEYTIDAAYGAANSFRRTP